MTAKEKLGTVTRRDLLRSATAFSAASLLASGVSEPLARADCWPANTVRDRFWLWSHVAGAYSGEYGLIGPSRITPVEAAWYLSIPNVFMVEYNGEPKPENLKQYEIPFRSLQQVAWSIVDPGANGTPPAERAAVLDLAFEEPVITGVVMDDFFVRRKGWSEDQVAALSVPELKEIRKALQRGTKRLKLWAVLYAWQVNSDRFPLMAPFLELCDVVQIWPWYYGKEIDEMPATFAKVDKFVPGKKKAFGSFMWNFGEKRPLPIPVMEQQCNLGLKMLRSGTIEAIIFGTSWICDRGYETVDWTRKWIHEVGSEKL